VAISVVGIRCASWRHDASFVIGLIIIVFQEFCKEVHYESM